MKKNKLSKLQATIDNSVYRRVPPRIKCARLGRRCNYQPSKPYEKPEDSTMPNGGFAGEKENKK